MAVRLLPENTINRIAAGEVVERPASAVKELVENSIDAGARRINVVMRDGGRTLISVTDDGCGMNQADLELATERHATSKLPGDDLIHIQTLGFRGEALPSIGAVSRMLITSRARGEDCAWSIAVEGGAKGNLQPSSLSQGTRVEVRDLFFATPARLKFLKTARAEQDRAVEAVNRLAMANPEIAFSLNGGARDLINLEAAKGDDLQANRQERLCAIMGAAFAGNALPISARRGDLCLDGFIGLPDASGVNAGRQFLFVNGRPVQDKTLAGALRAAYGDLLASGRYPAAALFLQAPLEMVDVNVHPAKTEVRFCDASLARGLIIGAIRNALAEAGHKTSSAVSLAALGSAHHGGGAHSFPGLSEKVSAFHAPLPGLETPPQARNQEPAATCSGENDDQGAYPLGAALAQLHDAYILAQNADGFVIVDQHAAHERLTHERLKQELDNGGLKSQPLLIPEVVEMDEAAIGRLMEHVPELLKLGLAVESFGPGALVVRAAPDMLASDGLQGLIRDLADDLVEKEGAEEGVDSLLAGRLEKAMAVIACHASVRAGRRLNIAEMNALLRRMEKTPHSGQCSHGRPTYVELKLSSIEKMFKRR